MTEWAGLQSAVAMAPHGCARCAGSSREIRARSSSIHFQVIKPKSGLIGCGGGGCLRGGSVTQRRSIPDREIWPERRDEITGGVCVPGYLAIKDQKKKTGTDV